MNIGFIGTGAIAQAVIQGLCTCAHTPQAIWVSPRNPHRAQQLAASDTQVTVAANNQAVVDHCDWVFITVKPDIAEAVLAELRFSPGQKVVNCVSTLSLAQAQALIGVPVALFKAIPLTPIALHLGPIAFTPSDPQLRSLFAPLGSAVGVQDEAALRCLAVVTAQIAPFYALQATIGHRPLAGKPGRRADGGQELCRLDVPRPGHAGHGRPSAVVREPAARSGNPRRPQRTGAGAVARRWLADPAGGIAGRDTGAAAGGQRQLSPARWQSLSAAG